MGRGYLNISPMHLRRHSFEVRTESAIAFVDVSEMVRAGEAIARLREQDRRPLYTAPRVTVRAFQALALVKSVEERREALLALLEPEPRPMVVGATGHAVPADQVEGLTHALDFWWAYAS